MHSPTDCLVKFIIANMREKSNVMSILMDKEKENSGVLPEREPLPDEIEAVERANKSIAESGTVSHDEIDWN